MHPHASPAVATNSQVTDQSFEDSWRRNDKPLSLTLTLQMNDRFFRQGQSVDAHRNCPALLSTSDQTQSAHNEAATSTPPQRQVHSIEPSSSSLATIDDSLVFTHANAHPTQASACDSADHSSQLSNNETAQSVACHTSDQLSTALNLSADEVNTLRKVSVAIRRIIQNEAESNNHSVYLTPPSPVKLKRRSLSPTAQAIRSERRRQRYQQQRQVIAIAKKALKPAYTHRTITKEQYKTTMKKVVMKATFAGRTDQKWIERMIGAYVNKYRTVCN